MSLKPRQVDFEQSWSCLLDTIQGVITCDHIARATWNDRFTDVYALCVAYPEPLGDKLYAETKKFLEGHVEKLYEEVSSCGDENLLTVYHRHWQQYSQGSSYMNQLYGYLNTQFIKKQKFSDADINYGGFGMELSEQMLEIGELALDTWKRVMIDPLKKNIVTILLQDIQKDRQGRSVNQGVLHGVITSLVNVEEYKKKAPLQLYETVFETPFLKETGDYYRQEAAALHDSCNCSEYMEKVIQRLDTENYRSRKFLHPSSYTKVERECEQRTVADHLQFLHGECKDMVQNERRGDLKHMYRLLKPIQSGLGVLIEEVEDRIKGVALDVVKGVKGGDIPTQFIESMLEVHSKYNELIKDVFHGDQQFIGALDKACSAAINYKPSPKSLCRSPDLIAKYCDQLLKKSAKGMSESEIDDRLAQSITIFKYLDDKDIYQRVYSRMLAKRLIHQLSHSMDAEEAMINRLKQACGYEFTNKLHRMFTDITLSKDLHSKFAEYLDELRTNQEEVDLGVSFNMMVLQAGAWPLGQANLPTFSIPQELEKSVRMFERFYNSKFSGRKLTWMHNFCNAELRLSYLSKPYFVNMPTFLMGCLLPFNNALTLTYGHIAEVTNLPESELVKQLQSLVDAKLLLSEGEVTLTSSFNLNMKFANKRTKFKITTIQAKETPAEAEQTHSAVEEDRKMYLQAAVVRIMKARKVLKHNMLIQEVISQSRARFAPSIGMIKKCIEALIDKQYLERTQNSSDEYSYVA